MDCDVTTFAYSGMRIACSTREAAEADPSGRARTKFIRSFMRVFTGLVLLAAAGCAGAAPVAQPAPSQAANESNVSRLTRAAVTIFVIREWYEGAERRSEEGTGSGFLVHVDGATAIATAAHVVAGASKIQVRFANGQASDIDEVTAYDSESDLALLAIDDLPERAEVMKLESAVPDMDDEVILVSSPLGLETTISHGTVAAYRASLSAYQLSVGVSPGSSGGLVTTKNGRLLGVIRSKASARVDAEDITFVTPASLLSDLARRAVPRALAPKDTKRMQQLVSKELITASESEDGFSFAKLDFVTGSDFIQHYCASADGPDVRVGFTTDSDEQMEDMYTFRSCRSFAPEREVSVWIATKEPTKHVVVTLEGHK